MTRSNFVIFRSNIIHPYSFYQVQDENIYENFKEYYNIITSAEREVCQNAIKNLQNLEKDIQEVY